ncbi:hypothetical protein EJ02DRAFT_249808 [Clathrospora elynae]|uniref:Xylanolytic transcriptional activator regulatory domain-containing protein n=1 Tax=Clathrospora elynae TaxID=706981 RepID=A0A6A5T277_9PLEO|nr:hypothetical protein EJ02DRAFT_249808 [Clathrospora elynae]
MQFPGLNFDLTCSGAPANIDTLIGYPTPGSATLQQDDSVDFEASLLENFQLPHKQVLIQLVDLFFEHLCHMFPCFHKKSFIAKVRSGDMEIEAPLLLYAICAVTARYHPDDSVKRRGKDWYEQARFSYELTRRIHHPALRTLQAVPLLVFHAYTIGDFSASWLFLGKAWRQAVVLGMNRMDASHAVAMGLTRLDATAGDDRIYCLEKSEGKTLVEREEYRRALWLLFMMDRMHAWPTGWPAAITETQFKVDIPIADTLLQALDPELEESPYANILFTRNLSRLIASSSSANHPLNLFHYIAIAHILLGRVAELIHSLHNVPDTLEYADDCAELDAHIVRFRLSLPRQATYVLEAPPADRGHVVWLHITLNTMAILLHYRCSKNVPVSNTASQFTLAVIAARNTAQIVKDASRISTELLLSAHIGSSLYVAACVLVIQWRLTGDESLKEDIELFGLVFERMDEVFSFLGLKFKFALEHDLKRSEGDLMSLRERGFRGLLADCSKWEHVKEGVKRRGIDIDIS